MISAYIDGEIGGEHPAANSEGVNCLQDVEPEDSPLPNGDQTSSGRLPSMGVGLQVIRTRCTSRGRASAATNSLHVVPTHIVETRIVVNVQNLADAAKVSAAR
jgi:hypothetical protein